LCLRALLLIHFGIKISFINNFNSLKDLIASFSSKNGALLPNFSFSK
jgi:hypothetical protein